MASNYSDTESDTPEEESELSAAQRRVFLRTFEQLRGLIATLPIGPNGRIDVNSAESRDGLEALRYEAEQGRHTDEMFVVAENTVPTYTTRFEARGNSCESCTLGPDADVVGEINEETQTIKDWVVTKCGHTFHHECLLNWLRRQGTCPTCRQAITSYDKRTPLTCQRIQITRTELKPGWKYHN